MLIAIHLDLQAVRVLCDTATPGPWAIDNEEHIRVCDGRCGKPSAFTAHHHCTTIAAEMDHWRHGDQATANARLIAVSRTLVPQLLAEVERLTRERDEAMAVKDRQALHITHLVMQLRGHDWSPEVVALRAEVARLRGERSEATPP